MAMEGAPRPVTNPMLSGNWAPVEKELTLDNLSVSFGQIPADIDGFFVRIGPNPRFHPVDQRKYHLFAGDGMVHCVELKDGRANYRNRWVETAKAKVELVHGEPVKMMADKNDEFMGNANTAMVWHNGRLLCLVESDKPYQVILPSLETAGRLDFNGQLKHAVTAHPKVCSLTGDLVFFGYGFNTLGSDAWIHYSCADSEGNLKVKNLPINFRQPSMVHDMAITSKYSIVFDFPLWNGKPAATDVDSMFGVFPRYSQSEADVKWFAARGQYSYHTATSWDEGELVHLFGCSAVGFDFKKSNVNTLKLHRWTFDMSSGKTLADEDVCDVPVDFPVVNPAYSGQKHRYIWATVLISEPSPLSSDGILKYDIETGHYRKHTYKGGRRGGEVRFCPRKPSSMGSDSATIEDDGYLLVFTHVPGSDSSDLYIIDAASMNPEPVSIISIGARVPNGFHALYVPGDEVRKDQQFEGLQPWETLLPADIDSHSQASSKL